MFDEELLDDDIEGWHDEDTEPGWVRRFFHDEYHWKTVRKSRYYGRWAYEHMRAERGGDE